VAWGWSQGLLQYRDVFDNHMPVFHILSAPLVALIGEDPRILFFMRLAMLPLYAASLWGAYQIGRSLFGEKVGLWSALFLGLLPAFFYNSLEFRTDNLWTVLLTLAVAVLVGGRWTGRRALSGGLLLGAALSVSLKTLMVVTAMTIAALALPMVLPPKPGPPGRSRQEGIKLAALVAGICVLPLAVTLFFARQNALGPFYYCVVLHNVVPGFGRWRMPWTLMGFPPLLVFLVYGVRRLVRRVEPAGGAKRLAFVTLMAGAFFLLNEMVWPVNTAPTRLPLFPLLVVSLTGISMEGSRRLARAWPAPLSWGTGAGTWMLPCVAAAGLLLLPGREPLLRRPSSEQIAMVAGILRLTDDSDYVMDLKGETIFRKRAFYYVLEPLTMERIARGTIPDRIAAACIATHAAIVVGGLRHYPPKARQFIEQNYLPVGPFHVAGHLFPPAAPGDDRIVAFQVEIPGRYSLLAEKGAVTTLLDGRPYSGARYLAPGRHELAQPPGEGSLSLLWARAAEGGFSPFKAAGPRP